MLRIVMFYKVVKGKFLTPISNKRKIKTQNFSDYHQNPAEKFSSKNSKCFKIQHTKTSLFRQSFFNQTTLDWNHLEDTSTSCTDVVSFKEVSHFRATKLTLFSGAPYVH